MRGKTRILLLAGLLVAMPAWAQQSPTEAPQASKTGNKGVIISSTTTPPVVPAQAQTQAQASTEDQQIAEAIVAAAKNIPAPSEAVRYTLGPDDVISVTVQRHPEFSGTFPVNLEGKIQMQFAGDVDVTGLTKKQVEDKITKLISGFVVNPEVNVTIMEYRSKVYYVIGEVGRPGKFFMRSDSIPVREAVVEAGLPTVAAAMRKCRLITPASNGKIITKNVDLYAILYGGNLKKNLEMRSGDFLYVPATVMAKVFRVIAPITEPVTSAAGASTGVNTLTNRPPPGTRTTQ